MNRIIHPVAVAYQDVDLSWMIGRRISEVSFHQPTLWYLCFGPDANIGVECLWRIIKKDRIVLTSEDHEQKFGLPAPIDAAAKAIELLSETSIAGVELREATADLVVEFTGDLRLEIVPTSSGYESWKMQNPFGIEFFVQGGGTICRWPA